MSFYLKSSSSVCFVSYRSFSLTKATPFDNALDPLNTHMVELVGETGSVQERARERSTKRRNTIRWFKETQARKVMRDGAFPGWFHGMITRR